VNVDTFENIMDKLADTSVAILPDFFVDRVVRISSLEMLIADVHKKSKTNGGSLRGFDQVEMKGGNAVNVAYACGNIGININLLTVADTYSSLILNGVFSNLKNIDLNIIEGKPGYTVALEFPYSGRLVNVMLNDVGDLSSLGPELIPDYWWKQLPKTKMVGIFNWSSIKRCTELAKEVFNRAKKMGVKTYFAPADPTERKDELVQLFDTLKGNLDILSVNENEARMIAESLSIGALSTSYNNDDIAQSAHLISRAIEASVDIHTQYGSATSSDEGTFFVESFKVNQNIAIGAGDIWDSLNIAGYLLKLKPEIRLKLANAAAGSYISSDEPEAPTRKQIISFLNNRC